MAGTAPSTGAGSPACRKRLERLPHARDPHTVATFIDIRLIPNREFSLRLRRVSPGGSSFGAEGSKAQAHFSARSSPNPPCVQATLTSPARRRHRRHRSLRPRGPVHSDPALAGRPRRSAAGPGGVRVERHRTPHGADAQDAPRAVELAGGRLPTCPGRGPKPASAPSRCSHAAQAAGFDSESPAKMSNRLPAAMSWWTTGTPSRCVRTGNSDARHTSFCGTSQNIGSDCRQDCRTTPCRHSLRRG